MSQITEQTKDQLKNKVKIKTQTLLVELGTEELPPTQLPILESSFKENFAAELKNNRLEFDRIESFSTPRRLALQVFSLVEKQPDIIQERQGPSLAQAFAVDGAPTTAGLGFAKSCGVELSQLSHKETATGAVLAFSSNIKGKATEELIPCMVQQAVAKISMAKSMRWGDLTESFVRPVHWLVVLFGKEVIATNMFAISAGRYTYGHRFHCPRQLALKQADDYVDTLNNIGMVMPNSQQRQEFIRAEIERVARENDGEAQISAALLELVTGLVEYPVVMVATFAAEFLDLPKEALVSAMQQHQKCFPIADQHGQLLAKFILVSNINSTCPQTVVCGNERVMHARLADAEFHYQQDKQRPLTAYLDKLQTVIFQQQLGSIHDKILRIQTLAAAIAKKLGAKSEDVARAALLCKSDLMSQMVGEFPELQGIMGFYYARNDGENKEVATAIREHYLPRHAQDCLPRSLPGICVALADRIDTLVGLFAIGKAPTADKDPFALRRHALGVLRILLEKSLHLDLQELFTLATESYGAKITLAPVKNCIEQLMDFCFERLRGFCADKEIPAKTFAAVLAKRPTDPFDFYCRLKAVQAFQELPVAASLSEANKRVHNILAKANMPELSNNMAQIDPQLLLEVAENNLARILSAKEIEVAPLLEQADYTNYLQVLATLKPSVDDFFDHVMVLAEDLKLRNNRLLLLTKLRNLFLQVADISLL